MDYIPYGEEWIKEMNKLPKDAILRMFSKMGIEKNQELKQLQSSLKEKDQEIERLNVIIRQFQSASNPDPAPVPIP